MLIIFLIGIQCGPGWIEWIPSLAEARLLCSCAWWAPIPKWKSSPLGYNDKFQLHHLMTSRNNIALIDFMGGGGRRLHSDTRIACVFGTIRCMIGISCRASIGFKLSSWFQWKIPDYLSGVAFYTFCLESKKTFSFDAWVTLASCDWIDFLPCGIEIFSYEAKIFPSEVKWNTTKRGTHLLHK